MSSRETDHGLHERALASPATDPMDRTRFPVDEWALVESTYDGTDLGVTETLFAVGNGYLGLRGNVEEGRDTHTHGTFVNGFHETWRIQHAEDAYGLARVGPTSSTTSEPWTSATGSCVVSWSGAPPPASA